MLKQKNNKKEQNAKWYSQNKESHIERQKMSKGFPPKPLTLNLNKRIISGFVHDTQYSKFAESGCAVCGQLNKLTDLIKLNKAKFDPTLLINKEASRKERFTEQEPIRGISTPLLALNCDSICVSCFNCLTKDTIPSMSLANGLWLGEVPTELKELTVLERTYGWTEPSTRSALAIGSEPRWQAGRKTTFLIN